MAVWRKIRYSSLKVAFSVRSEEKFRIVNQAFNAPYARLKMKERSPKGVFVKIFFGCRFNEFVGIRNVFGLGQGKRQEKKQKGYGRYESSVSLKACHQGWF